MNNNILLGGNAPIYLSNTLVRFNDKKIKATEGFGVDGAIVTIDFVKSRSNKSGQSCDLVFDQENGFDDELSLLHMLKEQKMIGGAGAYFYLLGNEDKKFSQKNFKTKLREDEEFRNIFINTTMEVLKRDVKEVRTSNEEEVKVTRVSDDILSKLKPV